MKSLLRVSRLLWGAVLTGLLLGLVVPARAQTVTLVRPNSGPGKQCGIGRNDTLMSVPPTGYVWDQVQIEWRDLSETIVLECGDAMILPGGTSACYECVSSLHPNNSYKWRAIGYLKNISTGQRTAYYSPYTIDDVANPCSTRIATRQQLRCSCEQHAVPTGSMTSPLSGAQSFSVPIISWDFKGATYDFSLTYNTHSLFDPQAPAAPEFSGLGERNSYGQSAVRWSHPYAQWIDRFQDENGVEYAVWHIGGAAIPFKKNGSLFDSEESYLTLQAGGGAATSPSFPQNGSTQTLTVPYTWYTVTDGEGTKYDFNYRPPAGQQHLVWQTSEATALPHYLLTRIRDRYGRTVNLTWSGGAEPRVTRIWTSIREGSSPGVRLYYKQGLLTAVTDDFGRAHTLTYSPVPDERGVNRQRLTQVRALGPGSNTNPPHWIWSFVYRDPADPKLAYGGSTTGTYTGDLVIQKTEPDGKITNYRYEAVGLAGNGLDRYREEDWDGRVTRIAWVDPEAPGGERVITRTKETASQFVMTYPGGVGVRYEYMGEDLAAVTDMPTLRRSTFEYDDRHNLITVRSPLEFGGQPLVQYDHVRDGTGKITQTTVKVRQPDGSVGDPVVVKFNALNLPYEVTATAKPGGGLNSQITQFQYDNNGPLTRGNLTKIIEAVGIAGVEQQTNLHYDLTADGQWDLPNSVVDSTGATTTFDYHNDRGWLIASASPPNLVPGATDPTASVTVVSYNDYGLPITIRDPENHTTSISYTAVEPFSPNMLVTFTYPDGNTSKVTLDPYGRILIAEDENHVQTRWTYTPAGAVKSVTRAYMTVDQTITQFFYDARGDLSSFIPPNGYGTNPPVGQVTFEYYRYDQSGNLVNLSAPIYEGQVTRINHPDGTAEVFGYYKTDGTRDVGELEWYRKQDGGIVTFSHDEQHRVTQVQYPSSTNPLTGQVVAGFTVSQQYDEFGRVKNSTDLAGTTVLSYDELDRMKTVTPPFPQKALTYQYTPDLTLQRWITKVTVTGIGDYYYREDTKGRIAEIQSPSFAPSVFTFRYDKDDKNTYLGNPNGTSEVSTYNNRDWLETRELHPNGWIPGQQPTSKYTYLYGAAGNLLSETDRLLQVHGFTYDYLYRLRSETHPDLGANGIQYTYDANGNRLTRMQNSVTDYYGVNSATNRLEWVNQGTNAAPTVNPPQPAPFTSLIYDGNGRLIRRSCRYTNNGLFRTYDLAWDGDDHLREVKEGTASRFTALYAGDGLRVNKNDAWTGNHDYSWGPDGVVHDSNGTGTVYTSGLAQRQGANTDRFYHSDWLGSTRWLSDGSGTSFPSALRYDAFGNRSGWAPASDNHPSDFLFGGSWGYQQEYDSTTEPGLGLQYLEQRYYDPAIGRFISPDPIGFDGGLNLYEYAGGNPVMNVDPEGEVAPLLVLGGVVLWWWLASESPADEPSPTYEHTPIVDQFPFSELSPYGRFKTAGSAASRALNLAQQARGGSGAGRGVGRLLRIKTNPSVGKLRKIFRKKGSCGDEPHHIIQNAAVQHLPGYDSKKAPGIRLRGPSYDRTTPHGKTRNVQQQRGGGTYAAERRIAYKALRKAGVGKARARGAIGRADRYFESIGVTPSTPTRIPSDRRKP